MEEAITLVNLRFDSNAYYKLNITVRNIGHRDVWIASVGLNGTNVVSQVSLAWNNDGVTVSVTGSGLHAGTYHLISGNAITFAFRSITTPVFSNGNLLVVVVATEKGTRAVEQWKAGA